MQDIDFRVQDVRPTADDMKLVAKQVREDIILAIGEAKSGHPGGSLSCTDILVTLYFNKLRHDPKEPKWANRDRLLLSKGHAAPALYSVLAECGYFPREELMTLRKINTRLQGHPDPTKLPGVEIPGGPEGIGLSEGIGMALAARLDKNPARVYVIMGDGELDEGEVWEAAMSAPKFKIDNLTAIVDNNGLQQEGRISEIMPSESIAAKFRAFNWNVMEINGHEIPEILDALKKAEEVKGMPTIIVAHTIKGKGVDFMEGNVDFHGKAPNADQIKAAIEQIRNSK